MEYHSVYMFFNLLYLKYQVEENSSVKIDTLRDAFYEYEHNINSTNNTNQELDFETELESVLEDFSCIFEMFDDEISFTDEDPDDLYEAIPEFLDEKPTPIDIYMEDFISEENIFFALKLKPPFREMQSIFETNKAIINLYELIAKQESEGKDTTITRKMIKFHKNNLKEFFKNADNKTRIKIRLCLANYNDRFLSDKALPNINANWHIALLSDDEKIKVSLIYDKIMMYLDDEEDEERIESKDLPTSNSQDTEDQNPISFLANTCYVADEIVYFFANYILYLNNYIKQITNPEIKRILIERKCLLLSTNTLEDTEDYFLEKGSLDDLPLPAYIKEWFNDNSFSFLISNFEEILDNIKIPDVKLNSFTGAKIIINLLLLKCYLELSINEQIKNELKAELTNPEYYKNPNYSNLTEMIDDIIFSKKGVHRTRNKGQE